MAKGYVGVPSSYTPIEYIESSGTQYIDTGFKHNQNTRMVADLSFSDISNWSYPFGSFGGSNGTNKLFCAEIDDTQHLGSYFGSSYKISITASGRHSFDLNKNVHKIDNSTHTFSAVTMQSEYNDLVFGATGYDGNANLPHTKIKLYSFKLYDNGTLIRDFIPVIDQDNVACLYDLVEGNFYYNKGTGTFAAGSATGSSVVAEDKARRIVMGYVGIPTSYTPVEYIESSGTQYIDTGVPASATLKTLCDMSTTTGGYPFGVTPAQNVKYYGANVFTTNQQIQSYFGTTSSYTSTTNAWTQGQRFVLTANDNYKFYKDSTQIADYTTGTTKEFDNSLSITIFALNGLYLSSRITMKLYGFKMYDGGTLVRDFIPAIDQDNVACLYEQVEGKFYYNKGTGSFTAGSATGQTVSLGDKARKIKKGYVGINGVARLIFPPIPAYTPLSYIEGNGTQYIDTEVFINDNTCVDVKFAGTRSSSNDYLCGADNPLYHIGGISGNYLMVSTYAGEYFKLAWADTSIHTIVYNDINKKIKYDGSIYEYGTATFPDSTTSVYLFTKNPASGTRRYTKVYYCKISNRLTGELYRDLVPAIRQEDGVVCLFDKVSNKFFVNKGTGNFIAGPTI